MHGTRRPGCHDGDHRAWITVEAESHEEARCVVPPVYRARARVIALNRFSLEELDELVRLHTTPSVAGPAKPPHDVAVEAHGLRRHQ